MKALIVGATSGIAEAIARQLSADSAQLCLAARDLKRVELIGADLRVRGATDVHILPFDAAALDQHERLLDEAWRVLDRVDLVVIAHGTLSNQEKCSADRNELLHEFQINATSVIALAESCGNRMSAQRHGALVVLSSVAGDRGRASNYVYGAAKAAITAHCSGLRQRLAPTGVSVLTVKPGFVDTAMTAQFRKGALWASPEQVARDILRAIKARKPVLYTPWFWRLIMLVVRSVPERVFVKFGPR